MLRVHTSLLHFHPLFHVTRGKYCQKITLGWEFHNFSDKTVSILCVPIDYGKYSVICELDSLFIGPCILQSPLLLHNIAWERLCVTYSLSSHNVKLAANLLSASDMTVYSRILELNGSVQCIANPATNEAYRLQLIATGYFASPSHVEWAEIQQISLLQKAMTGKRPVLNCLARNCVFIKNILK